MRGGGEAEIVGKTGSGRKYGMAEVKYDWWSYYKQQTNLYKGFLSSTFMFDRSIQNSFLLRLFSSNPQQPANGVDIILARNRYLSAYQYDVKRILLHQLITRLLFIRNSTIKQNNF